MSAGMRWRVRRDLMLAKAAGAVVFAALAVVAWSSFGDRAGAFLAAGAAVLLGVLGLRDLVAPERLAADHEGLTVVDGFAGRRRLAWSQVERAEVREHSRYGLRWQLLEIETDDDLYQFGAHELGVPCADAAAGLASLRSGLGPAFAPVPPVASPDGASAGTRLDTWPDHPADDRAEPPPSGGRGRE